MLQPSREKKKNPRLRGSVSPNVGQKENHVPWGKKESIRDQRTRHSVNSQPEIEKRANMTTFAFPSAGPKKKKKKRGGPKNLRVGKKGGKKKKETPRGFNRAGNVSKKKKTENPCGGRRMNPSQMGWGKKKTRSIRSRFPKKKAPTLRGRASPARGIARKFQPADCS